MQCKYTYEFGGSVHNRGDRCDKKALCGEYCSTHVKRKSVAAQVAAAPVPVSATTVVVESIPVASAIKEEPKVKHQCAYVYVKGKRSGHRCQVYPREGEWCSDHRPTATPKCTSIIKKTGMQCQNHALLNTTVCGHHLEDLLKHRSDVMKMAHQIMKAQAATTAAASS